MNWAVAGGIAGPLFVLLAAVFGYLLKQHNDRKDREARVAKEKADREEEARKAKEALDVQRAREAYAAMQEDLTAARTEARALRGDISSAQADMAKQQREALELWSRFGAMSRAFDAAEAHIADVHRWDDNGRNGPMPRRPVGEVT